MQAAYDKYSDIQLVSKKSWSPTTGNPGSRRGPTEPKFQRKQKTGPKSKFSEGTLKDCFRYADRNPDDTLEEIADHLRERISPFRQKDPLFKSRKRHGRGCLSDERE